MHPLRYQASLILLGITAACANAGPSTAPTPPPEVDLVIEVLPSREIHVVGTTLEVRGTIVDAEGNETSAEAIDLAFDPENAIARHNDGSFELLAKGELVIKGCLVDTPDACDQVQVLVDDGAPVFTILSPEPGAQMLASESPSIHVVVDVESPDGLTEVAVNGYAANVAPDGTFEIDLPPFQGINHIDVSVTDGIWPTASTAEFDVLWAYDYLAPETGTTIVAVERAIALSLAQRFFDDRMAVRVASGEPIVTRDLVDTAKELVKYLELNTLFTNPVVSSDTIELSLEEIQVEAPVVRVDLLADGIALSIRNLEFEALLQGFLDVDGSGSGRAVDLNGRVTGIISITSQIQIQDSTNGYVFTSVDPTGQVDYVTATFSGPDAGFAKAAFDVGASLFRTTLDRAIQEHISTPLADKLSSGLLGVVDALKEKLERVAFPLGLGVGEPLSLEFHGDLVDFSATQSGRLSAAFDATVGTSEAPLFPSARGVPIIASSATPRLGGDPIHLEVPLVVLNGVLHTLWNSGGLALNLDQPVPNATITTRLPPVLREPREGESGDLVFSFGQLELTIPTGGSETRIGIAVDAAVYLKLVDGLLSVTFAEEPVIFPWRIGTSPPGPFTLELIESVFKGSVWTGLRSSLEESLTFEIPLPSLNVLGELTPELGEDSTLELLSTHGFQLIGEDLVLDARIDATFPVR